MSQKGVWKMPDPVQSITWEDDEGNDVPIYDADGLLPGMFVRTNSGVSGRLVEGKNAAGETRRYIMTEDEHGRPYKRWLVPGECVALWEVLR